MVLSVRAYIICLGVFTLLLWHFLSGDPLWSPLTDRQTTNTQVAGMVFREFLGRPTVKKKKESAPEGIPWPWEWLKAQTFFADTKHHGRPSEVRVAQVHVVILLPRAALKNANRHRPNATAPHGCLDGFCVWKPLPSKELPPWTLTNVNVGVWAFPCGQKPPLPQTRPTHELVLLLSCEPRANITAHAQWSRPRCEHECASTLVIVEQERKKRASKKDNKEKRSVVSRAWPAKTRQRGSRQHYSTTTISISSNFVSTPRSASLRDLYALRIA